jgi:acylphosphatase
MKINKIVRVSGKVQGVYFRQTTMAKAQEFGITGWVKNEHDGSVAAELEGDEPQVSTMLEWMKKGPERASVDELQISEGKVRGYADFRIIR